MKLNDSGVVFDEAHHIYTLNGVELSGITGLLHERLFPHMYDGIPERTLAEAAERGKEIHSAIQVYDEQGIMGDAPAVRWYDKQHIGEHLASEYLVTDGRQFASAIDKVYNCDDGVILADIKTTSKLYIDYVSWQLSVYAYLFGLINPSVKIVGLYAIWYKDDQHNGIYPVARHSAEDVEKLLYTDEVPAVSTFAIAEEKLAELRRQLDEARKAYDDEVQKVFQSMEVAHEYTYHGERLQVTRTKDTEQQKFDAARFKVEHPDIYANYIKTTPVKGSLRVKLL